MVWVLEDLVQRDLVVRSGRDDRVSYSIRTHQELLTLGAKSKYPESDSLVPLVWVLIFREGPLSLVQLARLVPATMRELESALAVLVSDGKVSRVQVGGDEVLAVKEVVIPIGESAGWEAAVIDHHRMVSNAIAAKVASGCRQSSSDDRVGGTTLTFDLWAGHPKEQTVCDLLSDTRQRVLSVWNEVEQYNKSSSVAADYQVHFYCGQYLVSEEQPREEEQLQEEEAKQ